MTYHRKILLMSFYHQKLLIHPQVLVLVVHFLHAQLVT